MFALDRIHETLGLHGLRKGERLMKTWFSRLRAIAPNYSAPVSDVVTMNWALYFERARKVYDQLVADQIWFNKAAREQIGEVLRRRDYLHGFQGTQTFGDLSRPVAELDADYVNFRPAGGSNAPIDDLTAALGSFTFRVVVSGTVSRYIPEEFRYGPERENDKPWEREGWGYLVRISEVGIYIRDSFDFEGEQFLGFWALPGRYPRGHISALPFEGGELVMNSDFVRWRKKWGRGGDFLVFSDLRRIEVDHQFVVTTFGRELEVLTPVAGGR